MINDGRVRETNINQFQNRCKYTFRSIVIHSGEIKSLQIMLRKSAKNRKCVIV